MAHKKRQALKVWLDSKKPKSTGWTWVKTPKEAANLVETGRVRKISISYYLDFCIFTGLDFLRWLKMEVFYRALTPPKIIVHNTPANKKKLMKKEIEKIYRLTQSV